MMLFGCLAPVRRGARSRQLGRCFNSARASDPKIIGLELSMSNKSVPNSGPLDYLAAVMACLREVSSKAITANATAVAATAAM